MQSSEPDYIISTSEDGDKLEIELTSMPSDASQSYLCNDNPVTVHIRGHGAFVIKDALVYKECDATQPFLIHDGGK